MDKHLNAIIPLALGMALLILCFAVKQQFFGWVGLLAIAYGGYVHHTNVVASRRRESPRPIAGASPEDLEERGFFTGIETSAHRASRRRR